MKNLLLALALMLIGFQASYAQCSKNTSAKTVSYENSIVDLAVASPDHTTLVAALKAADLVPALQAEGPFTVFAPGNDAFDKLPEGTVESLLKPENKAALTNILTYHVIPGKLDATAVVNAIKAGNGIATITALNGEVIQAMIKDGKVYLKDAKNRTAMVTATDLKGSNGVIHVINEVILP